MNNEADYGRMILPEVMDLTNTLEFKQGLQSLYDQGCGVIMLDCSHLQMIDNAGLGSLVLFQKKLKERGGELRLVKVTHPYIKHLFQMIDLARVIHIEEAP
ncbi:MAG: STAS domain-containing protein [Bacillota bacterium]